MGIKTHNPLHVVRSPGRFRYTEFDMNQTQYQVSLHGSTDRVVASSSQITEIKQHRAQLVLGWVIGTRVMLAATCGDVGQASCHAASVHQVVTGTWWNMKDEL